MKFLACTAGIAGIFRSLVACRDARRGDTNNMKQLLAAGDDLLTLSAAARELNLSEQALRRRANLGMIRCVRLYPSTARVFRRADVARAKASKRTDK